MRKIFYQSEMKLGNPDRAIGFDFGAHDKLTCVGKEYYIVLFLWSKSLIIRLI